MSSWQAFFTIVGMAAVTVLSRAFFLFPKDEVPLPAWFKRGLRYAPLAAMAAIVAPEIVTTDGQLIHTFRDARPYAAIVASMYYAWRRGILGTIVSGTATMLALRLGLGW